MQGWSFLLFWSSPFLNAKIVLFLFSFSSSQMPRRLGLTSSSVVAPLISSQSSRQPNPRNQLQVPNTLARSWLIPQLSLFLLFYSLSSSLLLSAPCLFLHHKNIRVELLGDSLVYYSNLPHTTSPLLPPPSPILNCQLRTWLVLSNKFSRDGG